MKKFLLLISLLAVNLLALAQTTEELKKAAIKKIEQHAYLDATALVDKALGMDNSDCELYSLKAELEYELEHSLNVILNIYKAIALKPKASTYYNIAGGYYNSFGLNDSAIAMYNRAAKFAESDSVYYTVLSNRTGAYMHMQNFKAARKDIEICLKKFPDHVGYLNNASIIYWNSKLPAKTFECLDKAARLDSSNTGTFINLGLYHTEAGNLQVALTNFNKALDLCQNSDSKVEIALLHSNRGYLYYKMGENTQALKDLNKSLNGYPTNSYAYRNRALVYMAMNKKTEACRDLEAALYHGFSQTYSNEVKNLARKNCK